MRFDLHIHSCLSPCANPEMTPRAIVHEACAAGLDAIALCDHNSARNCPALREACQAEGLLSLYGMEIATAEGLHALALFDTTQAALAMTGQIYAALPPPRGPLMQQYGAQTVMTADDRVVEEEGQMLGASVHLYVRDVAAAVHELGGLFIASHVDRAMFSISSQLGVLAGDEGFDAMELTRHAERAIWRRRFPGLPILCASDAHQLCDIGSAWNEADLPNFSIASLRAALAADAVHCVIR